MAASLSGRASGRAEAVATAITEALRDGNHQHALNLALRALQSEAAKLRRQRPADGAVTDAELAGSISGIAALLHAHAPARTRRARRPRRPCSTPTGRARQIRSREAPVYAA